MRHKQAAAERLLVVTLMVEAAIEACEWNEVKELLDARYNIIAELDSIPKARLDEIGLIEERILNTLRKRLAGVRGDLRNLNAALRIATPYARAERPASLSLAG